MGPDAAMHMPIARKEDSLLAQQTARAAASQAGFPNDAVEEVALVAAELASNLLRYAHGGAIVVRRLENGKGAGVEIESVDRGPGIPDVNRAIADGFSSGGGLGYGLGTVNRLMDELEIVSSEGHGTHIVCRRRAVAHAPRVGPKPWDVGAATRSRRWAPHNGDAYVVMEAEGSLLAGVIDGLGHGEPAQKASAAAQQYVRRHAAMPLEKIFAGVDRACRGTRGVVMSLARLGHGKITFAGIGNVRTLVVGADAPHLLARRGILGTHEPDVKVDRFDWRPGWMLAILSDGIRSGCTAEWLAGEPRESAQMIAQRALRNFGSEEDDATIVVVKS